MKTRKLLCYAMAVALLTTVSTLSWAQDAIIAKPTATASWEYPVEEEKHIQGFRIFWGRASHADVTKPPVPTGEGKEAPYQHSIDVAASSRSVVIEGLEPGTYFFQAVAFGVINDEPSTSDFAEEYSALRDFMRPQKFKVTISNIPIEAEAK